VITRSNHEIQADKAQKLGVKIIDEAELLRLCGEWRGNPSMLA
jgi:NAD-dependent DNA ligase